MSAINIVHVSQTPLVGAPAKIAKALCKAGFNSSAIALTDYPQKGPLYKKFTDDMLVWNGASAAQLSLIKSKLTDADIIHVHNDIPKDTVKVILENNTRAGFVYQVHSPLREGPLYVRRAESIGLPFSAHLVVAQYQPRHYQDYIAVPNLVDFEPGYTLRSDSEKLKIIFSPSHSRSGRWNAKYSEKVENDLKALAQIGAIELIWPETALHPNELMRLRQAAHVTIDEVMTGAFHQISLEGLCAGNVTINRADYFSKAIFAQCTPSKILPPFVYSDESSLSSVLLRLAQNPELTRQIQIESVRYFTDNMLSSNLIDNFKNVYSKIQ